MLQPADAIGPSSTKSPYAVRSSASRQSADSPNWAGEALKASTMREGDDHCATPGIPRQPGMRRGAGLVAPSRKGMLTTAYR
jgi:hypothetical protein